MIYFLIYFSRNIAATIHTTANATTNSTGIYMYKLSEVKFLGDKKRPTKGFYLEVWKIDSAIFLYRLTFELSQHTVFIFVKVCIYVRPRDAIN